MRALIAIRMDSDAFHEAPGSELCCILRLLALRIEAEAPTTLTLRDSDGTDVGVFDLDTDRGRS